MTQDFRKEAKDIAEVVKNHPMTVLEDRLTKDISKYEQLVCELEGQLKKAEDVIEEITKAEKNGVLEPEHFYCCIANQYFKDKENK